MYIFHKNYSVEYINSYLIFVLNQFLLIILKTKCHIFLKERKRGSNNMKITENMINNRMKGFAQIKW